MQMEAVFEHNTACTTQAGDDTMARLVWMV